MAALLLYVIFSIIVVLIVAFIAGKKGRSALKWGIGAALVMYHLVFWDFIPTWAVYKYYCATKAGFWVYKTPEQWKAENPGVAETLTWREMSKSFNNSDEVWGYVVNERIAWSTHKFKIPILPIGVFTDSIIDIKTNDVLVKRVRVGSRSINEYRFWVNHKPYIPNKIEFADYLNSFKKLGREIK